MLWRGFLSLDVDAIVIDDFIYKDVRLLVTVHTCTEVVEEYPASLMCCFTIHHGRITSLPSVRKVVSTVTWLV